MQQACAETRMGMRILWVCNIMLPAIARQLNLPYSNREGWLSGLLERIALEQSRNHIELGIAFPAEDAMADFSREMQLGETLRCKCYAFAENLNTPEIYDPAIDKRFQEIIQQFNPDIVHVFGTEFPHALSCVRTFGRPERTLISIQGLCSCIADVYMSGLPAKVQRKVTFRDFIRKDSLRRQQKKFMLRGEHEKEALRLAGHIAGRTDFDREQTARINPTAEYHYLNETMRTCFYSDRWRRNTCHSYTIFLSQGDYPLKGFHYVLQAMPKILKRFPFAQIFVAGNSIIEDQTWKQKLKLPAYGKYLKKLIQDNHLENKVTMLGKLTAEQMKERFLESHVFVLPSALENSPNSLGEAMLLGVPCVAADVGGVHNLLEDGGDGLLYPSGDVEKLADCIIEIFSKEAVAERFSDNARKHARDNHDGNLNYYRLCRIYREMSGEEQ